MAKIMADHGEDGEMEILCGKGVGRCVGQKFQRNKRVFDVFAVVIGQLTVPFSAPLAVCLDLVREGLDERF
jgi:hypothetical protein